MIVLYYGPQRPSFFERIARFMAGRNGFDRLCRTLTIVYFALLVINVFARSVFIMAAEYALLIYIIFRVLSRNLYARRHENMRYYELETKVIGFFRTRRDRFRDRQHVYRKCPHCKRTLRLPRLRGRHTVKCPCCKNSFKTRV